VARRRGRKRKLGARSRPYLVSAELTMLNPLGRDHPTPAPRRRDLPDHFSAAQLDGLRTADRTRTPVSGRQPTQSNAALAVRPDVFRSLDAAGGPSSPQGSALWSILGFGLSLDTWTLTHNWDNGVSHGLVEGHELLCHALAKLSMYYYEE
jgi:hypothetical protein